MYEASPSNGLQAGDVVSLDIDDFKKIVRHESLLGLFEDFEKNSDYNSHLWAILNKNCDMVHDENKSRYFSNNLFIAPLQGLKVVLNKGTLGNLLFSKKRKPMNKIFVEAYKKYLTVKAKKEYSQNPEESLKDYQKKIGIEIINPIIEQVEKNIGSDVSECSQVQDLLKSLERQAPESLDIEGFKNSSHWKEALKQSEEANRQAKNEDGKIILKKDAVENKLPSLTLNQLDSQGMFYYEPDRNISDKERDLSYLIQLEDMVTVKIKPSMQKNGGLVKLLTKNRRVSLKGKFSDRLLNIMGNYFSKIGTPDVMADKVLLLYNNIYPNSFFLGEKEFEDYQAKGVG